MLEAYPVGVYRCFAFWQVFGRCEVPKSQRTKRQKNAFVIYVPTLPLLHKFRLEYTDLHFAKCRTEDVTQQI